MNENAVFKFLAHNISLNHFLWCMALSRFNMGGVIGNWIKLEIGNKFFDVEIKLTIKRKPTAEDKQLLKEYKNLDLDKLAESLK